MAYRKPLDRPFFTVSLRDAAGRLLEPPVDTPPGHYARAERCIAAAHAVTLRTPLQDLPGGALPPWYRASCVFTLLYGALCRLATCLLA